MTVASVEKVFLHQMGNHFGVGLSVEAMTLLDKFSHQRDVVLDNAVVNHDDSSRAVTVRVSILFGGTAVRGPASVANSVSTIEWLEAYDLFKIA